MKPIYYFKLMYGNEIYVQASTYEEAQAYAERTMECQVLIGYGVITRIPADIFVHKI